MPHKSQKTAKLNVLGKNDVEVAVEY